MRLLNFLTVVLLALKITGVITCSWWLVFLPSIIYVSVYAAMWVTGIIIVTIAKVIGKRKRK
ncbi:hypothetical protein [Liquorilactobacillus uvarum]|uniref:hypothetical protein n=1 Tax=Liquorilactobacillus uvarum TaxID=303240 RepID=UPI0007097382|nr:hypothetical protein [Liquorilactobacillus uvarum]